MSESARTQLAHRQQARQTFQLAKGEIPEGYALSEEERLQKLLDQVPKLDKPTAIAAISRGSGGGPRHADNDRKRSRYQGYLEYQAGFGKELPPQLPGTSQDDWLRELHEFYNCARIFKPMTGAMASRFTTSSSNNMLSGGSPGTGDEKELVARPPPSSRIQPRKQPNLACSGI